MTLFNDKEFAAMHDFHVTRAQAMRATAELIHDSQAVQAAVKRVAQALNARFGAPDSPAFPLVLGVMGGAVVFTGHLLTQLTFPLEYDYIHVSRYEGSEQGGQMVWKVIPRPNVKDRTVIVLDDILDEGETLAQVRQRLMEMGAAEVVIAVFADKKIGKQKPVKADYIGLTVPNKFVVGFGMDAHGYWRNLPDIWALQLDG